ncbi:GntR family transcriptional regulator [Amycolatopsis jejuensis]|uniref:GntR family transcriptional regulator n=1 Tax=Amycolatopsis jejuensis TaxID=330084 RepID=UPI00138E20B6|nr:GntR family transcriptional regulator [Amycolatopsis jejuensis]
MSAEVDRPDDRQLRYPLASRVEVARDGLIERMKSGAYADGRLPREDDLAKEQRVSRTTIRAVLQSLERDGVVSRRHGIGTFINFDVLSSPIPLNRLAGFEQLIQEAGAVATVTVTRVAVETAPEVLASAGLDPAQSCVLVDKTFHADKVACARVRDVFPESSLTAALDPQVPVPGSTFTFAERHCVEPIDYAMAEIEISLADEDLSEHLRIASGTPLIRLKETHYGVSGNLLGFSFIDCLAKPMRLMVLRRNG